MSLFAHDAEFVIHYSGGLSSHLAAHRIIEEVGASRCVLLFADTKSEDADLYRFIGEGSAALGCELVTIADGRNIWQVFRDVRFLGNSRVDPCSKILKREMLDRWVRANAPDSTGIIGYTVCEPGRWENYRARKPRSRAPLMEAPTLRAEEVAGEFASLFPGIAPPRLYAKGAKHNNCGGGCVKAGQAHFDWLRRELPDVYAEWEREEESLRQDLGDVSILRDRRGGKTRVLTLKQFRERMEGGCVPEPGGGHACRCMDYTESEAAQ